jgi:dTDP-4-dehydrorhamnose reductase
MKIIVFGDKGMLGRYVYTYFSKKGYDVVGLNRDNFDDIVNFTTFNSLWKRLDLVIRKNDIVINCIGTIKPKFINVVKGIQINSLFPHYLSEVCLNKNAELIHITTDCVFSGNKGNYIETDIHDALDEYGKTKSLGEPKDVCVLRTSIIGYEVGIGYSLLNWVISQNGKTINGYTNHTWNGVTCFQLTKIIENIILDNLFWKGVRHIYTNTFDISKKDLLLEIIKAYSLDITVIPVLANTMCDRTLRTKYLVDGFDIFPNKEYRTQLLEQKEFDESL